MNLSRRLPLQYPKSDVGGVPGIFAQRHQWTADDAVAQLRIVNAENRRVRHRAQLRQRIVLRLKNAFPVH